MRPWLSDPDVDIYVGDALETLRGLPDGSVDCCVTSPPYWGLRDYGTEGQLGLEASPVEYVAAMVAVFAEVRRVLADRGTLWLNIGDSYASSPPGNTKTGVEKWSTSGLHGGVSEKYAATLDASVSTKRNTVVGDLKPKDLVGIPWRLAFALQADGWWLRSDIVWSKPNPMPESVTDRPTKAHEMVFLLSKRASYFYDADAIAEPADWERWGDQTVGAGSNPNGWIKPKTKQELVGESRPAGRGDTYSGFNGRYAAADPAARRTRNARSVWEIATQPYPDAHFATFPEELPRRCIAAGCPEWVCASCGKPRERIVEVESSWRSRSENGATRGNLAPEGLVGAGTQRAVHGAGVSHDLDSRRRELVGWSDCGHGAYRPGITLDPFMGSGATALVARKLGRRSIGIELSPEYAQLAARRLQQLSLLAEAAP